MKNISNSMCSQGRHHGNLIIDKNVSNLGFYNFFLRNEVNEEELTLQFLSRTESLCFTY